MSHVALGLTLTQNSGDILCNSFSFTCTIFPIIHRIRMRGVTGRMSPKIVDADVPQFSHSLLLFNIYFYIHWKRSIIPYHTLTYRKPLYQQNKSAMKEEKNNTQKSHIFFIQRELFYVIWKYQVTLSLVTNDTEYQWVCNTNITPHQSLFFPSTEFWCVYWISSSLHNTKQIQVDCPIYTTHWSIVVFSVGTSTHCNITE